MKIQEVTSILAFEQGLYRLLVDCIESGASVGFLTPVEDQEIRSYWNSVEIDLRCGQRRLFLATEGDDVLGAVQLSICSKANGNHRGEVEKLMVHRQSRGQGLSKSLMSLMERSAIESGLLLLVLDTRLGDIASKLYRSMGYIEAGQIPQFARSSSGKLESTVYFYKQLHQVETRLGHEMV